MKFRKFLPKILLFLLTLVSIVALCSATWYIRKYGYTGFMSILSTFFSPWSGCADSLTGSYLLYGLLPACVVSIVLTFTLFFIQAKFTKIEKWIPWITVAISVICIISALSMIHFPRYVYDTFLTHSTLYEEEYVDPADVTITFPEEKRNLVYIFLESMETSFLSEELGGGCEENLIPQLYSLAQENQNFSHNDDVGGWPTVNHATWTSAAMVSQTSGVPLSIDPTKVDLKNFRGYVPGATTIQDILHEAGYYQALMVGSDASYGGRKEYYQDHGVDQVYDLHTAREAGLIPDDYFVWWGFEDYRLFDYAKTELTNIAAGDQPFAFTLLTVDTHHVDGYTCTLCQNEHEEPYGNVMSCSSRQVEDFVNWLKEQDFYENTTVIICGDHPSMDNQFFRRNVDKDYERHVYNCIINAPIEATNSKNRSFTPMDMFPTALAAIGCEIEGDRLGLGTNLFSDTPTLAEEMGIDVLNREITKYSDYYYHKLLSDK